MPSFLQLVPTFVHTKQFSFTWQCIFLIEFNFCTFCWMVVLHFSTTLIATLIGMLLCIISSYIYLLFSSNFDVTGMHMTLPYLHFRNHCLLIVLLSFSQVSCLHSIILFIGEMPSLPFLLILLICLQRWLWVFQPWSTGWILQLHHHKV